MLPTNSLFSDMTKGRDRFSAFIRNTDKLQWKLRKIRHTVIKNHPQKHKENSIHLHPKHCWPPSPERSLSGLSSRNLCLTGNQSACALGLKACHPSNCPCLDLETDTRLNFGSSFQKCVTKKKSDYLLTADKAPQPHQCCFSNFHSQSGSKGQSAWWRENDKRN